MNVLVVDDDEMVRYVLTEKLAESGFTATAASDGCSALEIFRTARFDAVLLDLKMPGMDGIETLKELLKRDAEVPVIMVTAFGDIATAVEAIKLGAYDFVEKPPQISRIGLTLRRAIEKAAMEREIRELGKSVAETSMLKKANDKLVELDRIKTAFLSSVSHELRTPLTSIIGYAEICRSKLAKLTPLLPEGKGIKELGQVAENLEIVTGEARRLTELIDNLLELTALVAGTAAWNWAPVSLAAVIEDAARFHAPLFEHKGIGLTVRIPEELPAVRGDAERLGQVLRHLLANALKFTEHGQVTVSARRTESGVRVSVADTGRGIPEALHRVIFDKFRQLGETLTDKPKGVGLGLAICKQIVDYHGGTLSVASEPGHGSVFSMGLTFDEEASR
jgi:signal transduction histidine kinase